MAGRFFANARAAARRGHHQVARIERIHPDAAVRRSGEVGIEHLPVEPAVLREQQPGARVSITAEISFARAGINQRRIGRRKRDGAHRQGGLIVGAWTPVVSRIGGLPNAALGRADQPMVRVGGINRHGSDPAAVSFHDVVIGIIGIKCINGLRPDIVPIVKGCATGGECQCQPTDGHGKEPGHGPIFRIFPFHNS